MSMQPSLPRRKFPRLKGYDYSQPGVYFVTICVYQRQPFFGEVNGPTVALSSAGVIAKRVWKSLTRRFPGVALDAFVIMPNHVHGLIVMTSPPPASMPPKKRSLGEMVRTSKGATSRLMRVSGNIEFGWQQKYWDTIIRTQEQLDTTRHYIANNPINWTLGTLLSFEDLHDYIRSLDPPDPEEALNRP